MSGKPAAVFLSYAHEDAVAARRLAEGLRAAGIEAWVDTSELQGGDAWDREIRARIRDCALFLPLISAHANERSEGYFRLEWKLAVDRSHAMAHERAFLLPVAIDATTPAEALVPDRFNEVQWSSLPGGEVTPGFLRRVARLLADPLRGAEEDVAPAAVQPARPATNAPGPRGRMRVLATAMAILLVLAAVAFVALRGGSRVGAPAPTAPPGPSIAVLPFVDLSEAKDQGYFADGMAEEVLDLLAKMPALRVAGRTSSFRFRGHDDDLRTVADALGATYVVAGSVRKAGSRVRVAARLVEAATGVQRWSENYDRDFGDVLVMQDEIAAGIARSLQLSVAADDVRPPRRRPDPEAYTLYLQGRALADRQQIASLAQALGIFEQALALDPAFLAAAEAIALTRVAQGLDGGVTPRVAWREARAAADRALRIDPQSPPAHAVLGLVHALDEFDWEAADREFARALAANPRDPVTLNYAARVAHARGRHGEALARIGAALALDPLNPYALQTLGEILYTSGDLAGAERAFRRSLASSPTSDGSHYALGRIFLVQGQLEAARAEMEAELALGSTDLGLALVYDALGRRADADAILRRETATDPWPYGVAVAYARRGDTDHALAWLEKDCEVRDPDLLMFIRSDPDLDRVRGNPRFAVLLRRLRMGS